MRTLTRALLAAVAVAALAACSNTYEQYEPPEHPPTPSPTGTPTVMEEPTIIWADGVEPTSDLEDHPLVKTLREADLGYAMAWNSGDFTITQLNDNFTPGKIAGLARDYSHQYDTPRSYPMTGGWQPLEILSYNDDGGQILVCEVQGPNDSFDNPRFWRITATQTLTSYDRSQAKTRVKEFTTYNGTPRILENGAYIPEGGSQPCDGSTVPIGILDPAPALPPATAPGQSLEPVRPPLYPDWDNDIDGWSVG